MGSADANRFIDKGTIYEIYNDETDFSNADSVCKRDNGRLSKIIPEPGAYILNDPMSEFLRPRIGDSCVWDGSSDRESEGNWAWTDGMHCAFSVSYSSQSKHTLCRTKFIFTLYFYKPQMPRVNTMTLRVNTMTLREIPKDTWNC